MEPEGRADTRRKEADPGGVRIVKRRDETVIMSYVNIHMSLYSLYMYVIYIDDVLHICHIKEASQYKS